MKRSKTNRGFTIIRFKDSGGTVCTIQESSSAIAAKIWIGAEDIGLQEFKAGQGWKPVQLNDTIEHHFIANNRMHLTQAQVNKLIPILQKFVKTGTL
jgi:hypothetical protein